MKMRMAKHVGLESIDLNNYIGYIYRHNRNLEARLSHVYLRGTFASSPRISGRHS